MFDVQDRHNTRGMIVYLYEELSKVWVLRGFPRTPIWVPRGLVIVITRATRTEWGYYLLVV